MKQRVLSYFQGLAPRFDPNLKFGWARMAENVDLASNKIRPLADAALQQADANQYNSLFYFNGAWKLANDRHYLQWKIADHDLLIYLDDGVPKKQIGTSSADLGQTRPGTPTTAANGAGVLDDTFYYIITFIRSVGGHIDESGPSAASAALTVATKKILVTCPAITDADVTHWNLYRMSNSSGEYQFVATILAATGTYDDNNPDADLGASPTTWYTSDQGNQILFDKPQVEFDGLITEPYTGMLFAWKGPTLYWSEPGYPDAWPAFYNMNFPSDIKRVIPFAGTLAVLCETGPHRVDGTHPELLQPSKVLGTEPCIGTAACATSKGVAYLSDSGVVLFNLIETDVVSDKQFTEAWFAENVTAAGAFMIENDGMAYLFHSRGVLKVDARVDPMIWTTMAIVGYGAYKDPATGEVYYIDAAGIQKLYGGDGSLVWGWQSGDILGTDPSDKQFDGIEVIGSGTVWVMLYVDGVLQASKTVTFASIRTRSLKLPEHARGRALQIQLTGTGTVDEIIVRYEL